MALTAAQLLDELMGRDRNLVPGEKSNQLHWEEEGVCKHFLVGFCVHGMFVNTKADYGVCNKLHDETHKTEYEKSSRYGKMGYEEEFLRYLITVQSGEIVCHLSLWRHLIQVYDFEPHHHRCSTLALFKFPLMQAWKQ